MTTAKKGLVEEKLSQQAISVALVKEGLAIGGTVAAMAKRLQKHFVDGAAPLVRCDECNGDSPDGPGYESSCPFCGSAEPIEERPSPTGAIVPAAPAEIVPVVDAVVLPAAARRSRDAEERKLDAALDRARVYHAEAKGAGWDLGNVLREIEEGKLFLARKDAKGVPVHSTFEKFCQAEMGVSGAWARNMIDVAKAFTREQAMALGPSKLVPMLRIAGDERARLLEAAPEMTSRQIAAEVKAIAGDERRVTDRDGGTRPHVNREGLKLGTKKRREQHLRETPKRAEPLLFPRPVEQGAKVEEKAAKKGRPSPRKLTMIAREGQVLVPLWSAKRKKPGDERRAQTIADDPKGRMRMTNGTELVFVVRMGKKGLVIDVTAAEVRDEA